MEIERPIAIYIRVSTRKQELENQRLAIGKWLELHGLSWNDVDYYFEEVESGAKDTRPQFRKLWSLVKENKVKSIVVYEISRLTRNQRTMINFLYDTAEHSITIYSIRESYLSQWLKDPKGRTIITGLLSILYDLERQMISERTKAGLERARREGKHIGRPPKLTPEQIQFVKYLRSLGVSWSEIARRLGVHVTTLKRAIKKYG